MCHSQKSIIPDLITRYHLWLQDVNNSLAEQHREHQLPVLSFGEGVPTTINNILPKLTVRNFSSIYHACKCAHSHVAPAVDRNVLATKDSSWIRQSCGAGGAPDLQLSWIWRVCFAGGRRPHQRVQTTSKRRCCLYKAAAVLASASL